MAREQMTVMTRLGMHTIDPAKAIMFPRGLIGFETHTSFTLLQLAPGSPFLVLQSLDDPGLGLLVADPYAFIPDFSLRVGNAEQFVLGVHSPAQLSVLVTASIPHGKPELATLNLSGPILINHEKRLGLQVPQSDSNMPARWLIHQGARDAAGRDTSRARPQADINDSSGISGTSGTIPDASGTD